MNPFEWFADRRKSRIAEGADPKTADRVSKKGPSRPLKGKDGKKLTEDEKLRAMVEELIKEGSLEQFILSLEYLKEIDEAVYTAKLEKIRAIQAEIEKGSDDKKNAEAIAIEIEKMVATVNDTKKAIATVIGKLDSHLEDPSKYAEAIKTDIHDLDEFIKTYNDGILNVRTKQGEYKAVKGIEYPVSIEDISLNKSAIVTRYQKLTLIIRNSSYAELSSSISYLRDNLLVKLLGNQSEFESVKQEALAALDKKQKPKDKILDEFRAELTVLFEQKFKKTVTSLCNLEVPNHSIDSEMLNAAAYYLKRLKEIGIEEKEAAVVLRKTSDEVYASFESKYTKVEVDLINFIEEKLISHLAILSTNIAVLRKAEYTSTEFPKLYSRVQRGIKTINDIVSKDEYKHHGIHVAFIEETETLSINFNSKNVTSYSTQIMNKAAIGLKHPTGPNPGDPGAGQPNPGDPGAGQPNPGDPGAGQPNPGDPGAGQPNPGDPGAGQPNPGDPGAGQPTGGSEDRTLAEQEYLETMNVINEKVALLNEINAKIVALEAHDLFLYPIDSTLVKDAIELEKSAKGLDFEIISLKTKLSNLRADYTTKFKASIYAVEGIKNTKISAVEFPGEYKGFVEAHDRLIVEAENKILELDERRKSDETKADEYTANINELVSFIESQNSAIGRCLVVERLKSNIDIVQILEERRENKKALREQLRKVVGKKTGNTPEPGFNPEPEADPSLGVSIKNDKLLFNPNGVSKINKTASTIITAADTLTVSIITNGIRIKYSQDLAKKLQEVKAKLAIVNKANTHQRKSGQVAYDPSDPEKLSATELAFKSKKDFNIDDYAFEIRNDDGAIYTYDLAELPEEEKTKSR